MSNTIYEARIFSFLSFSCSITNSPDNTLFCTERRASIIGEDKSGCLLSRLACLNIVKISVHFHHHLADKGIVLNTNSLFFK